ncbi:PepSY domain-containing protein [Altererythrobacter sp. KTW20L]|uniref:PepSY domain-containing protein n=1 Tax=Altererythrobacter sp. KTW20L TaxID=2942210 RepID=UPI0020C10979|nr:PepSY domain-containing protein [Altererythrobacter sp. KTW20L]
MWHTVKRWLYLTHRWIGIATCLLFVLWFVSGLVMLYVPYPALDAEERLAGLSPITWEQVDHQPEAEPGLREVALEMRGDRPVWRVSPWNGGSYSVWADSGEFAGTAGRTEAEAIAATFGKAPVEEMRPIRSDQWTVGSGYDRYRPLWKAELAGEGGRVLYVSSTTGEVVLDTARTERFWNWLGSIPHWLYPRALREDQPLWRQVVMWVSGPCILGAITGVWIGLMRIRPGRQRFKGGRMTPYRGWMKWHHVSGLVGSAFLILWIFSGWLSVDPFRLFASEGIGAEARQNYAGDAPLPSPDTGLLAQMGDGAHRVALRSAAGHPYLRLQQPGSPDTLLEADTFLPHHPEFERIRQSAAGLVPGPSIAAVETLTKPDAYWYAVRGTVPLPVLRVKFADEAATWVHIDPASGDLLSEADARRRTYRWLFDLFHRWDLNLLIGTPPARDLLIWLMSLAGLISSATAVVVGWRRLRRSGRPNRSVQSGLIVPSR